jgi:hypothetical protein
VLAATLVLALGALLAGPAPAQPAPTPTATTTSATTTPAALLYKDADLALGDKLLREHRCAECHVRKVGGDGTSIYRPLGRINSPGALRGMVEQCNLELNLTLFPDEVTAISAVLNRDHYRFK